MKILIWLIILTISMPLIADDGGSVPRTKVDMSTIYSHLNIDHHKQVFLKCSGGPDDRNQYDTDGGQKNSTDNSGSLNTATTAYGLWYAGHKMTWNSGYSNQTFDLNFSYDVAPPTTMTQPTECDDNESNFSVKSAKGDIESSVDIFVPEDVWFLQIKAAEISGTEATAFADITGSETLKRFTQDNGVDNGVFQQDQSVFFSTKPGDKITIRIYWKAEEARSHSLHARFKVSFVGQEDCENVKSKFGKFDANTVGTALKDIQTDQGLIFGIGCLLNNDFTKSVLENNTASQISNLISDLQSLGLSTDKNILFNNQAVPLRTVSEFAYYKIAFSTLTDISQFCKETTIKDLYTVKDGVKADGFFANNYYLNRIIHRLEAYQLERFAAFISAIKGLAKKFPTYKVLMSDPERAGKIKWAYSVLKKSATPNPGSLSLDILPYASTLEIFKNLQITATDRNAYIQMMGVLQELSKLQPDFTNELTNLIYQLSSSSDAAISLGNVDALLNRLMTENQHLIDFFHGKATWFAAADHSSPYIRDMTNLQIEVARFSGETLEESLAYHRPEFLKAYNPEHLIKEVNSCIAKAQ